MATSVSLTACFGMREISSERPLISVQEPVRTPEQLTEEIAVIAHLKIRLHNNQQQVGTDKNSKLADSLFLKASEYCAGLALADGKLQHFEGYRNQVVALLDKHQAFLLELQETLTPSPSPVLTQLSTDASEELRGRVHSRGHVRSNVGSNPLAIKDKREENLMKFSKGLRHGRISLGLSDSFAKIAQQFSESSEPKPSESPPKDQVINDSIDLEPEVSESKLLSPRLRGEEDEKLELQALNDEQLRARLTSATAKIIKGSKDFSFVFVIEEMTTRRLQCFKSSVNMDISRNLGKITITRGDQKHIFEDYEPEAFQEKCSAFENILTFFVSSITRAIPVEVMQMWRECTTSWASKTIDENSFPCCLDEFIKRARQQEDDIVWIQLAHLVETGTQHLYTEPCIDFLSIFLEAAIDPKHVKPQNVHINYLLDKGIALTVDWEISCALGMFIFSNELKTHVRALPKWSSNLELKFKKDPSADPTAIEKQIMKPLMRAGFTLI